MPDFDENGEVIVNQNLKGLSQLNEQQIKCFLMQPDMKNYLNYSVKHERRLQAQALQNS